MARYIDADKVTELIKNYGKGAISDGQKTLDPVDDIIMLAKAVELIPTADVVEVKRGKWIVNDLEIAVEYTCSVCGYTYCEADPKQLPEKYCCKCGGKNE